MKKLRKWMFLFLLLFGVLAVPERARAEEVFYDVAPGNYVYVYTETANLYAEPSAGSPVKAVLPFKTPLEVSRINYDWVEAAYSGMLVYVETQDLTADDISEEVAPRYRAKTSTAPVPGTDIRNVCGMPGYVFAYTSNGTPLYDYSGSGWPQYMLAAAEMSGVTPQMSDYEKAVAVNNFLKEWLEYDDAVYDTYFIPQGASAEGAVKRTGRMTKEVMALRLAICEGYANAYEELMTLLGVSCYFVGGYAPGGGLHAWNIVELDGVDYYVDVTWNDSSKTNDYLMLDKTQMLQRGYRFFGNEWDKCQHFLYDEL